MTETRSGNTKLVWRLVLFFVFYLLFRLIVESMFQITSYMLGPALPQPVADFMLTGDAENGYHVTGSWAVLISGLAFLISGLMIRGKALEYDKKFTPITEDKRKLDTKFIVLTILAAMGLALTLNILLLKSGVAQISAEYQETSEIQYSCIFPVGFVVYGFLSPFSEELMFRGILYNGLKRVFPMKSAMILSAALFALYHGNGIQGMFAFLISLFIIYSYEATGNFLITFLIHMVCNLISYTMTYVTEGFSSSTMWMICGISAAVCALSIYLLYYHKTDEKKDSE